MGCENKLSMMEVEGLGTVSPDAKRLMRAHSLEKYGDSGYVSYVLNTVKYTIM